MKKIGFIGSYDKIDMIINVAKILTTLGKKILVIDATINQKAKYVVPTISPTTTYVGVAAFCIPASVYFVT